MKVEVEEVAPCKKQIQVEVPKEEVDKKFDEIYRELQQNAQLPGFRVGKAPLSLLRLRFGDYVRDQVLEKLFPEVYEKALKEVDLKIATEPRVPQLELEEGEPLRFTVELETEPEFELGEYKGIKVKKVEYPVSEEDVDRFIEKMREQRAKLSDKEDQTAADGDLVLIDYQVEVDGEMLDEKKTEGMSLVLGAGETVVGFEEGVRGHKVGESFDVAVDFPEDHFDDRLAGKRVIFKIDLKEVKKRELPALDDEFAKEMGFEDLEALARQVREDLEKEHDDRAKAEMIESIKETLVFQYDFPLPPSVVEEHVDKRIDDMKFQLRLRGVDPDKAEVDWEGEREKVMDEVVRDLRFSCILGEIAKKEGVKVEEEELREKVEEVAQRLERPLEEVTELMGKTGRLRSLSLDLLHSRVLDFLLDNAQMIDEQAGGSEESGAAEEER